MSYREIIIHSMNEYLAVISEERLLDRKWIYRGQNRDYELPILPSIARGNVDENSPRDEDAFFNMFERVLPLHSIRVFLRKLDILAIGQHFKLKTRLLDWTLSPLIGMYFACDKLTEGRHSVIYACLFNDEFFLNGVEVDGFETDFNCTTKVKVYAPDFIDIRVYNQRGAFTVHPFDTESNSYQGFDANTEGIQEMIKFILPAEEIPSIKLQLEKLGLSPLTMYNTLEASAEYANNWKI